MAYGDFKDLAKKTASHKFLRDKAFNIAKNPKYDGYQSEYDGYLLCVINILIKNPQVVVLKMRLNKMNNWLKNCINQLLKNLKKGEFIFHLKTVFGF